MDTRVRSYMRALQTGHEDVNVANNLTASAIMLKH